MKAAAKSEATKTALEFITVGTNTVKVVGLVDGDTIDVLTDAKKTVRIRLHGIDCPERGQPFGSTAKTFLSKLVFGNDVVIVVRSDKLDKYDRVIGDVIASGANVNLSLLPMGLRGGRKSTHQMTRSCKTQSSRPESRKSACGRTRATLSLGCGGICRKKK